MKAFIKRGLLWVSLASALLVTTLFLARSHPVIAILNFDPSAVRPRRICIMNPFRDRDPEKAAERYLHALAGGKPEVIRPLVRGENGDHFVSRELQYRIVSWRVGRRLDGLDNSFIMYWVKRGGGYPYGEEEVHFEVVKSNGRWSAVQFGAIY